MGEVLGLIIKELSCHDCAQYVCNDLSMHSKCCDQTEWCECDIETRPIPLTSDEIDLELEVDNPGCMGDNTLCCFIHASKQ